MATLIGLSVLTGGCVPGVVGGGRITVTAYFPDTSGLFVGNDVGILGVTVGKITDIDPEGERVKVTLEVDDEHDVPADVGAVVVARSVATDRYVELTPVYDSGPTLGDGDVIPVERTRTPVDFDQVLGALNTFATGIAGSGKSKKAIRRLINSGARALDGRGQLVSDTVTDLADAVGSVSGQREDLSATIRSLDTLVATTPQSPRDLSDGIFDRGDDQTTLVTLRLAPQAQWVVEYYSVEAVRPGPDHLEVDLLVADHRWLTKLLLRLAPNASVVAPAEFTADFTGAAQDALALYRSTSA